MAFRSKKALMLAGGLGGLLRPALAQDAKLDITGALKGVSAKSLAKPGATRALAERVYGLAQPHLAMDAALDVDAVCKVIDAVNGTAIAEDDEIPEPGVMPVAGDEGGEGEGVAKLLNWLKGKLSDADYNEAAGLVQAEEAADPKPVGDEGDDEGDDGKDKPVAMDANSVKKAIEAARKSALTEAAAIRTAERDVLPVVGELIAMDSAAAVYKAGLEGLGVDLAGLPESAYAATFKAVRASKAAPAVAQDSRAASAAAKSFAERHPVRTKLIKG